MFFKKLMGVFRKRCPHCLRGPIYKQGMEMHTRCPECNLLYEREQGYFLGSLYVSYALASLFLGLGTLALHLIWPDLDLGYAILIMAGIFLPFVPALTRYSRVIWMYFDRWAWPSQPGHE